jgi:hypothetical protein
MMTTQGKSLGWHIKHEPLTTLMFFLALLSPWAGLVIGASANMSNVMIVTLAVAFLAVFLVLLLCSFFVEVKRDISPTTRSAARCCLLGIMSLLAVGAVAQVGLGGDLAARFRSGAMLCILLPPLIIAGRRAMR